MPTDDAADRTDLDALLRLQHGVLSLRQAVACGLSRHAVAHRISSGRWARVHPGVFATSTGLLSVDQRIWAAVLYAGPGATVGFRTAWWLADRTLKEPERVDVVIPDARIVQRQAGLRVRRTRRWPPEDLHATAQPPRFRIERAVLDCAAVTTTADQAVALLASAVQQRTTTVGRLRDTLARHPVLRRRKLLYEVLELAEAGAETLIEVAHARITAAHGLPEPSRQRRIGDSVTDAAYDCPDGSLLVAEFDGRLGHLDANGWWKDMQRDNAHTIGVVATLRFPGFILLTRPHEVAAVLAAALQARGWTGSVRCRSCRALAASTEPRVA